MNSLKSFRLILLFLFIPGLSLQAADRAQETLTQWMQATGGKANIEKIKNLYSRAAVAVGGLTGKAEDWNAANGDHKSNLDLGDAFQSVTVYDASHNQAWIKDQNGKVRELEGTDLQAEITAAYLGSFAQFFENRMKGTIALADENEQTVSLKLTPQGGRETTIVLDKKTHLPARQEQRQGDRIETLLFSDYRDVQGVQFPFAIRQTTGDPKYDAQITMQEIKPNVPLQANAFAKPAEGERDFKFASGSQAMGIPMQLTSNHIYVQVSVKNSPPLWFLLDTGADFGVINENRARQLGFDLKGKLEARGSGEKSADISLLPKVPYELKGVSISGQNMATIDMQPLEHYEGRYMDGILGYDFISRFVVEIDYAAGIINLYDPPKYTYKGKGYPVPLQFSGNTPEVRAKIQSPGDGGSYEGLFTLDTGSRLALTLNKPFHESHNLLAHVDKSIEAPAGFGVGGQSKQKIARIPSIDIGGAVVKDVLTSFSLDKSGSDASPDQLGNIGGEILRRFKVILDYSRKTMYLEPNSNMNEPFAYDMTGIALTADGTDLHTFKVINVVPGSPAADAGIQVGDVIEKIGDRAASQFTLDEIRAMFRKEAQDYALTTNRGKITLHTHPLI